MTLDDLAVSFVTPDGVPALVQERLRQEYHRNLGDKHAFHTEAQLVERDVAIVREQFLGTRFLWVHAANDRTPLAYCMVDHLAHDLRACELSVVVPPEHRLQFGFLCFQKVQDHLYRTLNLRCVRFQIMEGNNLSLNARKFARLPNSKLRLRDTCFTVGVLRAKYLFTEAREQFTETRRRGHSGFSARLSRLADIEGEAARLLPALHLSWDPGAQPREAELAMRERGLAERAARLGRARAHGWTRWDRREAEEVRARLDGVAVRAIVAEVASGGASPALRALRARAEAAAELVDGSGVDDGAAEVLAVPADDRATRLASTALGSSQPGAPATPGDGSCACPPARAGVPAAHASILAVLAACRPLGLEAQLAVYALVKERRLHVADGGAAECLSAAGVKPHVIAPLRGTANDLLALARAVGEAVHETLVSGGDDVTARQPRFLHAAFGLLVEHLVREHLKNGRGPVAERALELAAVEAALETLVRGKAAGALATNGGCRARAACDVAAAITWWSLAPANGAGEEGRLMRLRQPSRLARELAETGWSRLYSAALERLESRMTALRQAPVVVVAAGGA